MSTVQPNSLFRIVKDLINGFGLYSAMLWHCHFGHFNPSYLLTYSRECRSWRQMWKEN